jgi:hypothetical protein
MSPQLTTSWLISLGFRDRLRAVFLFVRAFARDFDLKNQAPDFSGADRFMPFPKGSIFENESAHWPYVCELVRYAREPQLRGAWHLHARRAHGDVRPDDDDARQRGDERQQRDDALARDASAIVPSGVPPGFDGI